MDFLIAYANVHIPQCCIKLNNKIMTPLKLAILFFFSAPMLVFGQWEEKNIATNSILTSVKFYDNYHGFVTGGNKIFKTINGGSTWESSFTGSDQIFIEDIFILDEDKVIAVGLDFGTGQSLIIRTINGGLDWESVPISNASLLRSIFFVSPAIGYCSGSYGSILKTTNSGITWQPLNSGTSQNLQSIYFVDEMNGIAVGGSPLSPIILKTENGGNSWSIVDSPSDENLQSVYFVNLQLGYIVGWNGEIMKTEDGGDSWTTQSSVAMTGNLEVFFTDVNTGYIVGGDLNESLIQKTVNGGDLWEDISPNIDQGLVSIHFPSFSIGYAVGANGTVLKTTSGGVVTSTQDISLSPQILTYPNPVIDYLSIKAIGAEVIESAKIYDNNGRFIDQKDIKSSNGKICFSSLEANSYFLVIQTDKGKFVRKIIKI